jgi:hypothetical protein
MAKLGATGVVYHSMALLGGGAVLAGLILGAIAAFIIDRKFDWAALFADDRARIVVFWLYPRHHARHRQLGCGGRRLPDRSRVLLRAQSAELPGSRGSCRPRRGRGLTMAGGKPAEINPLRTTNNKRSNRLWKK